MSAATNFNPTVYARLLAKFLPKPIQSEPELEAATALLLELDERTGLSPQEEALAELLTVLIEDYEDKHYPLPDVPPHESLKALMEDRGLKHKDIWPVLGNKGAATEILSGRRSISKAQAKRLANFFRVPVELFI
jgi:HTH-type transcriptional regulator / antitoxin HigA